MIMTLTYIGFAVISLATWTVTIVRWRDSLSKGAERFAWYIMADIAVATMLVTPIPGRLFNNLMGSPIASVTIINTCVFVHGVSANLLISAVRRKPDSPPHPRWQRIGFGALLACGFLLFLSPLVLHRDVVPDLVRWQIYDLRWGGPVYWGLYLGLITMSSLRSILMISDQTKHATGHLRTGLQMLLVAVILGLALMTYHLCLAWRIINNLGFSEEIFLLVNLTALMGCVVLLVVGGSYNLVSVAVARLVGTRDERRAAARLSPLWTALSKSFPVIDAGLPGGSELRLIRRVVEIRDGLLACQHYIDQDGGQLVSALAASQPSTNTPAGHEAARVIVAADLKTAGGTPNIGARRVDHLDVMSIEAEVRWLLDVADAYRSLSMESNPGREPART